MYRQDWQSIILESVEKYRKSEKNRMEVLQLKKELRYLRLQEVHNNLYKLIVRNGHLDLKYKVKGDFCEAILFKYPIYQILEKYRIYWLFTKKINRIETIYELLDKFFFKTLKFKYKYIHTIDFENNYQCTLKIKMYSISAGILQKIGVSDR